MIVIVRIPRLDAMSASDYDAISALVVVVSLMTGLLFGVML